MNEPEAFQLLTLASARDGRKVSQSVAKVWAEDLVNVALSDAVEAATEHYRASSDWMMPSHVIAWVKRIREARVREARKARAIEPNRVTFPGREWWDAEVAKAIEANRKGLS